MEEKFKPTLKYLKEHENQVSMILGAAVVLIAGALLLNVLRDGANGQSPNEVEPTVSVQTIVGDETTQNTAQPTLEAEGIESLLTEEMVEVTPTSAPSLLQQAGKAILGILGIKKAGEALTPDEVTPTGSENVQLVEQEDGTLMPQNLPANYTVKAGDQLWGIAEKYYQSGYNWVDIAKENKLNNANELAVGQVLKLPNVRVRVPVGGLKTTTITKTTPVTVDQITGNVYKVTKGDTLWSISVRAYGDGYQWTKIIKANPETIKNASLIEPGWELKLPRQ
jgi:nucleoid-associated protein YgaU